MGNNFSWYISNKQQQIHSFIHREKFQASRTTEGTDRSAFITFLYLMYLVACNCSYIVGFVSIVKETFQTLMNHYKG